eukprot:85461-Hanusia_phi.AAC.1
MRFSYVIVSCLLLDLSAQSSNLICDLATPLSERPCTSDHVPAHLLLVRKVDAGEPGKWRSSGTCGVSGLRSLRGGAGGGAKTRIEGTSRKGFWIGLRRSEDGGKVIYEDPALHEERMEQEERRAQEERAKRQVEDNEKHRNAGLVVSEAIYDVIEACKPGENISAICLL